MGSISLQPNGRYRARYRDASGQSRSRTFDRKSDATKFVAAVTTDVRRGEWVDERLGRTTFGEWSDRFMASRLHLRASGRARDESYVRNHVRPHFGRSRLSAITHLEVQAWVGDLSRGLSPRTVRECYRLLSAILRGAVQARLIKHSPCEGISLPRVEREEQAFLTAREVQALAESVHDRYRALIYSGAYLGLRWGEAAGLRQENLNLLRREVRILGALEEVNGVLRYVEETKTSSGRRTLALPPFLVAELAVHLSKVGQGEWVFPSRDGALLRRSNFRRRHFKPAVERAGLESRVRFHDLRHTCAALMISSGANVLEVQRRLGHADVRTTLSVYGHLYGDSDEKVARSLDQAFRAAL